MERASIAPTARHVFVTLQAFVDNATDQASVSVSLLVAATGLSERTIRYALRSLEAAGLLVRVASGGPTSSSFGGGVASVWRIVVRREGDLLDWSPFVNEEKTGGMECPTVGQVMPHRGAGDAPPGGMECPTVGQVLPPIIVSSQREISERRSHRIAEGDASDAERPATAEERAAIYAAWNVGKQ